MVCHFVRHQNVEWNVIGVESVGLMLLMFQSLLSLMVFVGG